MLFICDDTHYEDTRTHTWNRLVAGGDTARELSCWYGNVQVVTVSLAGRSHRSRRSLVPWFAAPPPSTQTHGKAAAVICARSAAISARSCVTTASLSSRSASSSPLMALTLSPSLGAPSDDGGTPFLTDDGGTPFLTLAVSSAKGCPPPRGGSGHPPAPEKHRPGHTGSCAYILTRAPRRRCRWRCC